MSFSIAIHRPSVVEPADLPRSLSFDPRSPKYRCFGVHVRTVAVCVACVEFLLATSIAIWATCGFVYQLQHSAQSNASSSSLRDRSSQAQQKDGMSKGHTLALILIGPLIVYILVITMLIGLFKSKSMCVLAHLLAQFVLGIMAFLAMIIYTVWCWAIDSEVPRQLVAATCVLLVLNGVFSVIVYRAHRFLYEKWESGVEKDPTIDSLAVAAHKCGLV